MGKREEELLTLDATLRPLFGELCWDVDYSSVTNLSMELGAPTVRVLREPFKTQKRSAEIRRNASRRLVSVSGFWNIWIYDAHWRIVRCGRCLATGSSSYRKKLLAIQELTGQRLVAASIDVDTGATRFQFDLETAVNVRRRDRSSIEDLCAYTGATATCARCAAMARLNEKSSGAGQEKGRGKAGGLKTAMHELRKRN